MRKISKPNLLFIGIFLLVVILVLSLRETGFQFSPEQTAALIKSWGVIAPLVYVGVVIVSVIIPPLTHLPFMLVMLRVFGFWVTYFSLLMGSVFGATFAFLVARRFGRPVVLRLVGKKGMAKVDELTEVIGWKTLLVLRLFAGGLFDYASYAAGLTSLSFSIFVLVTLIAILPGSAFFTYLLNKSFAFLPLWLFFGYILTSLSLVFLFWQAKKTQAGGKIGI